MLGSVGLAAELFLLGHFKEAAQWIPLVLIAGGIVSLAWDAMRPNVWTTKAFQLATLLQVAGGLLGFMLHYQSNVEFELEMYPDLQGLALVRESLTGAIPALAPGALIQLGLIGFAYTFNPSTETPL